MQHPQSMVSVRIAITLIALLASVEGAQALGETRVERPSVLLHGAHQCGDIVFASLLRKYAHPSTCMMVFCNGACAERADACDALSGGPILDLAAPGRLILSKTCVGDSIEMQKHACTESGATADPCCQSN